MVLKYALLGLLAARPMTGYDLTRNFENMVAHVWSALHSQIYPALHELAADGLIEQTASGPRRKRIYAITPAGLAAVRDWLGTTEPDRRSRNEAMLRTFFLWLLPPDEARRYLVDEGVNARRRLDQFRAMAAVADALDAPAPAQSSARLALEWGLRYEAALAQWSDWAARHIIAREEDDSANASSGSGSD